MGSNSEFVTKFYELKGDLIPERKKNFFKLLKAQTEPLNEEDLNILIPRTYLESLFQIDIFIYFKIITKLSEVLKGGNEVFISKILKHPFLLKQIIGDVSADSFVNDFLPYMSYAMRMKVLKKISIFLEESQMDIIVSGVHKRYGFDIAKKMLHTCSSEKINDYLSEHDVILKPRQVKYILDKDPELLVAYLKHYKMVTGNVYYHKNLCRNIAQKNPKFWLRLEKENLIQVSVLGRRLSKHFIKDVVGDLQSNVKNYSKFLKLNIIVKGLHGHFREVYLEFFPKEVHSLSTRDFSYSLLKYYPKKKQWDLFAQTYRSVFGKDILNDLINLNNDFLNFFPDKATMNKWAELKYNDTKDNDMLQYCDPSIAIPLVKEKINVTSDIFQRSRLLILLIKTCSQNKDLAALEGVLKYISIRHRNEDACRNVLHQVKNSFKLEELKQSHWNYIKEIIAFLKIKEIWNYHDTYRYIPKYLEYLILQRKPFKNEIAEFIRDIESFSSNFDFSLQDPIIKKQILTEMFKTYPELKLVDEKVFKGRQEHFVEIIMDFNAKNPEHTIELLQFPYLLNYVKSLLSRDNIKLSYEEQNIIQMIFSYNLKFPEKPIVPVENSHMFKTFRDNLEEFSLADPIMLLIKKKNRSDFEQQVLQFVWENLMGNYYIRVGIVPWFIDNEPRTVLPHIDRLLAVDPQCINMKTARLMSHLALDRKIIEFCTEKLKCIDQLKQNVEEKATPSGGDMEVDREMPTKIDVCFYSKIIESLSILLSTKKYIETVAQRFKPEQKKIDPAVEELREFYRLQHKVAGSFTKVQEPGEALPVVMEFCEGDYLQSALSSLYSVFYRAPEKLLYPYIEILSKRAVSVRKHALFLSCELLPFDYAMNMLKHSNETNVSSQKHVFSSTLKYFKKNPCDELLNQVISLLYIIDKNDTETFKDLVKIKVPEKYTTIFKEKVWYFFEDLRTKDVDVKIYLASQLQSFIDAKNLLESLPVRFCRHIIAKYFSDKLEKDYLLDNINRFVCSFLRLKPEQSDNFKIVFDSISLFKNNKSTKTVKNFFNEFYDVALKDIKDNYKIDVENNFHIEQFKQHWCKIFTPIEMFDEHVLLKLLYLKSKSCCNVETYAKEVVLFLEELIAQYGPYIYKTFKDLLFSKEFFTVKEKYIFFYNILTFNNSTLNCLLVIDLMECHCSQKEFKDIRRNILEILKSSNEAVVAINLNKFLDNEKLLN